MDSIDTRHVERRARIAYEMARLRHAVIAFAPMLALVALAALIGHRHGLILAFGAGLFSFGVTLLWYGHDVKRAVLPGIAAGLVPMIFALCARHLGHLCTGGSCFMVCVPACFAGGLIAGAVVAAVAIRGQHRLGFWVAASGVVVLTGAMGCVCVGAWGIAGLVAGYVIGGIPGLVRSARRRRA